MSLSQHILCHDDLPGVIMQEGDNDVIWLLLATVSLPLPWWTRRGQSWETNSALDSVISITDKASFLLTEKRVSIFSFHTSLFSSTEFFKIFCKSWILKNYTACSIDADFLITFTNVLNSYQYMCICLQTKLCQCDKHEFVRLILYVSWRSKLPRENRRICLACNELFTIKVTAKVDNILY